MNSAIKKSPDQLPIVYKCYHCRIKIMTQNSTPTSCKYVNYSASCVPYATTCTVLMFVVLLCPFIFTPPPSDKLKNIPDNGGNQPYTTLNGILAQYSVN